MENVSLISPKKSWRLEWTMRQRNSQPVLLSNKKGSRENKGLCNLFRSGVSIRIRKICLLVFALRSDYFGSSTCTEMVDWRRTRHSKMPHGASAWRKVVGAWLLDRQHRQTTLMTGNSQLMVQASCSIGLSCLHSWRYSTLWLGELFAMASSDSHQ